MAVIRGNTRNGAAGSGPPGAYHGGGGPLLEGEVRAGEGAGRVPLRDLVDGRLLDELLERSKDEAGGLRLTGEGSMLGELVSAVLQRALEGELAAHLGYGKHDTAGNGRAKSRNGDMAKTVQAGGGPAPLQSPRGWMTW